MDYNSLFVAITLLKEVRIEVGKNIFNFDALKRYLRIRQKVREAINSLQRENFGIQELIEFQLAFKSNYFVMEQYFGEEKMVDYGIKNVAIESEERPDEFSNMIVFAGENTQSRTLYKIKIVGNTLYIESAKCYYMEFIDKEKSEPSSISSDEARQLYAVKHMVLDTLKDRMIDTYKEFLKV
ncbi:MAG: hypothetical protein IKA36_00820 [Clostridia bacterium]|nr:hypothetical protein [Clostridia bacterium]